MYFKKHYVWVGMGLGDIFHDYFYHPLWVNFPQLMDWYKPDVDLITINNYTPYNDFLKYVPYFKNRYFVNADYSGKWQDEFFRLTEGKVSLRDHAAYGIGASPNQRIYLSKEEVEYLEQFKGRKFVFIHPYSTRTSKRIDGELNLKRIITNIIDEQKMEVVLVGKNFKIDPSWKGTVFEWDDQTEVLDFEYPGLTNFTTMGDDPLNNCRVKVSLAKMAVLRICSNSAYYQAVKWDQGATILVFSSRAAELNTLINKNHFFYRPKPYLQLTTDVSKNTDTLLSFFRRPE